MNEQLQDLKEIRQMMERSTKFLSLSGLSGISAGIVALIAAFISLQMQPEVIVYDTEAPNSQFHTEYIWSLVYLGLVTIVTALAIGFYFTWRKAKLKQGRIWNKTSKRLLISLCIPMLAGGFVILSLLLNKVYWIIPELTLVFYGLTLINAAQHTYRDVFYLGLSELILGIVALFITGYSLLFWSFGFGVLHIVYGISMHLKYERNKS